MKKRVCTNCGNNTFVVYKKGLYYLHKSSIIPFTENIRGHIKHVSDDDEITKIECAKCLNIIKI